MQQSFEDSCAYWSRSLCWPANIYPVYIYIYSIYTVYIYSTHIYIYIHTVYTVYIHTYIHTHIHTHTYTHIHTHTHTHTHTYIYIYIHKYATSPKFHLFRWTMPCRCYLLTGYSNTGICSVLCSHGCTDNRDDAIFVLNCRRNFGLQMLELFLDLVMS